MNDETSIIYEGGDGSSMEEAVIIKGAGDSLEGIRAEIIWILSNHPDWEKKYQALCNQDYKFYDRISYITPTDEVEMIYFDITDFVSKNTKHLS